MKKVFKVQTQSDPGSPLDGEYFYIGENMDQVMAKLSTKQMRPEVKTVVLTELGNAMEVK